MNTIDTILVTVLVALISWALKLGINWLSLHVTALKDARIAWIVEKAIAGAEEYVEALVKLGVEKFDTPKDKALAKMKRAIEFVVAFYPGVDEREAELLVNAYLQKMGHGAAAFMEDLKAAAASGEPGNGPAPAAQ